MDIILKKEDHEVNIGELIGLEISFTEDGVTRNGHEINIKTKDGRSFKLVRKNICCEISEIIGSGTAIGKIADIRIRTQEQRDGDLVNWNIYYDFTTDIRIYTILWSVRLAHDFDEAKAAPVRFYENKWVKHYGR